MSWQLGKTTWGGAARNVYFALPHDPAKTTCLRVTADDLLELSCHSICFHQLAIYMKGATRHS